jgi:predicted phosphate transport protein (TIGR00153 family)
MSMFGDLFRSSPIRPMQQHMKAALGCAREVLPLVEAIASGDSEQVTRKREEIVRLEHAADEIKHELRSHLPKRLFMAFERRDLLEILDVQDSIADVAQDIAELAEMRNMRAPEALGETLVELTKASIVTCEKASQIINELDELVETGFGPRESARVDEMICELGELESVSDELEKDAKRILFGIEDQLGVATYFWYRLIEWIADLADYAEKVGNRLRLLIAS